MTTLTHKKVPIPAASMGRDNTLPALNTLREKPDGYVTLAGEEDGLFLGWETTQNVFPYSMQDGYSRELHYDGLDAVILENDNLRATFTPTLGGRLWSLYDKVAGRELLFANPVFRPANLALRNAWFSGGVEWNCGAMTGHYPFTCSTVFTSLISAEESGLGCPVLRMYNYERIRGVVQQMDFYLPEGAKMLHCRMRVVNHARTMTPMYWWSNIAVPADPKYRNVVSADYAFGAKTDTSISAMQDHTQTPIAKYSVPIVKGMDVSYPSNIPTAYDYFYQNKVGQRTFTSLLDENGYGLAQTSTDRLRGRKIFVWGNGQGGRRWQEFLSGDDGRGNYNAGLYWEIQCGLATTQWESIPMPPRTAWEWMEYYGPVNPDPARAHSADWQQAQRAVAEELDKLIPMDEAERELRETHKMATTRLGKMVHYGEGWAALENKRMDADEAEELLSPHLDFGETDGAQEMWQALLDTGSLRTADNADPAKAPVSYQRAPVWREMLERATDGPDRDFWLSHYMLGCIYISERRFREAARSLDEAAHLCPNAWTVYAQAHLARLNGDTEGYADRLLAAARMAPDSDDLVKAAARALYEAGKWQTLYDFTAALPEAQQKLPRVITYRAFAAVHCGDIALAEELLWTDGGLILPDIAEGEVSITELWFLVEEKKAALAGKTFDRATARPPHVFDFRMNTL